MGGKVHSASMSSIWKVTLGGTQVGWMGEMSMPVIWVVGRAVATSLFWGEGEG